jgi:hypothetical protein
MAEPSGLGSALTRRQFLVRCGLLAALAEFPALVSTSKWFPAHAQSPDLVRESLNGLVAFALPGDDPFSVAQGQSVQGPGAVGAGTVEVLIDILDSVLPFPDVVGTSDSTVPLSSAVAGLLDTVALVVNPLVVNPLGPGATFLSPFARLPFADKARVLGMLEGLELPDAALPEPLTRISGNLAYLFGILPSLVAFLAAGEGAVFDPATRSLRGRPVSWELSGHQPNGAVEGWDELKGFYQGRRKASA